MDYFTKTFEHTLSKARMREMSAMADDTGSEPVKSELTKTEPAVVKTSEPPLKSDPPPPVVAPTKPKLETPQNDLPLIRFERRWSQESGGDQGSSSSRRISDPVVAGPGSSSSWNLDDNKKPEVKKSEPPIPPAAVAATDVKPAVKSETSPVSEPKQRGSNEVNTRRNAEPPRPAEAPTLLCHQRQNSRDSDSDLPPVIKISKAEIHSKVMSWPTSQTASVPKKIPKVTTLKMLIFAIITTIQIKTTVVIWAYTHVSWCPTRRHQSSVDKDQNDNNIK
eukprot:sb/3467978/